MQQHCLYPDAAVAPRSAAPWKAPPGRSSGCMQPISLWWGCTGGGAAPGSEDPDLLMAGEQTGLERGSLCALALSAGCRAPQSWAVLPPHGPSREHAAVGATHRLRNIVLQPLKESWTLTGIRTKAGGKSCQKRFTKELCKRDSRFPEGSFFFLNLSHEQKERFSLKAEYRVLCEGATIYLGAEQHWAYCRAGRESLTMALCLGHLLTGIVGWAWSISQLTSWKCFSRARGQKSFILLHHRAQQAAVCKSQLQGRGRQAVQSIRRALLLYVGPRHSLSCPAKQSLGLRYFMFSHIFVENTRDHL